MMTVPIWLFIILCVLSGIEVLIVLIIVLSAFISWLVQNHELSKELNDIHKDIQCPYEVESDK